MSIDLTTINQKKANDFLNHTLFDYLDTKGYLSIIYGTKGQVPGFTRKNASKAPLTLIKNIAKQRIKRIADATEFLSKYTNKVRGKYEDLTFHEFYAKISIEEKNADGEKLALFFLLYQEDYQVYEERIQENIKHQRPPLTDILSLSLVEKLGSLHAISKQQDTFQKLNYKDHFELDDDEEVFRYDAEESITLIEKLQKNPLPPPDKGYYLSVYNQFMNESNQWDAKEKANFLQLVIGDLAGLVEKLTAKYNVETKNLEQEIEDTKKEQFQLKETSKLQVKKIISLETNLRNYRNTVDDLELKVGLLSTRNEEQTKEIRRLGDRNDTYYEKIEKLQSNYDKLKKQYKEQTDAQNRFEKVQLFKKEKLYFITKIKNDKFSMFFADNQLIHLNKDVDLNKILQTKDDDAIYFLNGDGISTRESFKLEQPLKTNQLTYRIVSGGIENIIRKMIYYLEGELRDEVKEEH